MNDISFLTGFDRSANDFDPLNANNHFNEANANMLIKFTENDINRIDIFDTRGSPKDEDMIVKQDPFEDTPDWSSAASVSREELARELSTTAEFINGTLYGNCGNLFANTVGRAYVNNTDFNLNKSFSDQSSDLFTQYLSTVVVQQTLSNAISNSNESFFTGSNNSTNNSDHFNIDDQFSENNKLGFHRLNLTDASGDTINQFNDTENGCFGDTCGQRIKAHSITVLTADEKVVRPRPTSLAVKSQVLPGPPSKQSIKNAPAATILIKTPTQKMLTSTPLREEGFVEDKPKTRSPSSILPNVRNAAPAVETRAMSRARYAPLQAAPSMKESIYCASKSLEG